MKKLIPILLLLSADSFAAARYFVNGGVNNNWGTAGNWSATDGGSGGLAVPTAADDVHFTANSPNVTVDASPRVALSLDFTGYTGKTITVSQQITVSGSVTLCPGMTIAGSGALIVNSAATLTSNGKAWPNALSLNGSVTYTFADAWDVGGNLTLGGSATTTLNGYMLTGHGSLTNGYAGSIIQGTTGIILAGTGVVTGPPSGVIKNNLTVNTAGTITFAPGSTFTYSTGTMTHLAGTVVTANTTLLLTTVGTTMAVSGINWDKVTFTSSVTHTLNEDMNVSGLLSIGSSSSTTTINGHAINAFAGVRFGPSSGWVAGTTVIKVAGTGTLDGPNFTLGYTTIPVTIAAGSGTVTISPGFRCDLGSFKYESGNVVSTGAWTGSGTGGGGGGGQRVYSSVTSR